MSMFGGSWKSDMIADLRADGEHATADRIIAEDAYEHGYSDGSSTQSSSTPQVGIELNGVANIDLLLKLDTNYDEQTQQYTMSKETYDAIVGNLQVLKDYMIAYKEAINNGVKPPFWHEVRDNLKLKITEGK